MHAHNADVAAAKGQEAYDAAITAGRAPAAAQRIAARVQQSRMFSGGMTEADIVGAIADIQTQIGPARYQKVLQAAQAFWDTGRTSLDEKLAEGMISPALHQELTSRYPHYVRTDIADYFEGGPAAPSPGGKTLGVSNVGIKAISPTGTTKDRVNPVLSTIDAPYSHEAAVTRNRAGQGPRHAPRRRPAGARAVQGSRTRPEGVQSEPHRDGAVGLQPAEQRAGVDGLGER